MEFTAEKIAHILKGTVEGDKDAKVRTLSKIEEGKAGSISFLANPAYTPYVYDTDASVVIVNNSFEPEREVKPTMIRVEDAYSAFATLLEFYNQIKQDKKGISERADIHPSAKIGKNVYIGTMAVIGENVIIGDNTKIFPQSFVGDHCEVGTDCIIYQGTTIYSDNFIGNNCTIHSGVVIGADGFGFAPQSGSGYKKITQTGNVIIEDNVEIGANTTIDRATLGSTIIRKGVKLDNLIQVAHNVEIGENTVIAAQTGISGSTKIGKNCMIGGQVGIVGHSSIADNVKIGAQSGISSGIKEEGATVIGSPAFDSSQFKRVIVYFRNLPKLAERISRLEKKLK